MRVLMLHNRYLVPGGEDQSTMAEVALLRETGCTVELLERNNREIEHLGRMGAALHTVWSQRSYRAVFHQLRSGRFDVLHVQNFFPLWSPSVYYAAAKAGVPVVQTLRNYRLLCVNSLFFRDGHPCEECLGRSIQWPGMLHACYRDSRAGSAVVAGMTGLHRLLGTWRAKVDVYIALTSFARDKFIAGGLPADKIVIKPNFVHPDPVVGNGGGGYALYVGRLSQEKGIATLLEAWTAADHPLPLKIVGIGPCADAVTTAAAAYPSRIQYLGHKSSAETLGLMRNAELLVFPSACYEGMPRSIIESFSVGTPVLASKIGAGITMVEPDKTGFHFKSGDAGDLRRLAEWSSRNLDVVRALRPNARAEFKSKYSGPANAEKLLSIYLQARQRMGNAQTESENRAVEEE
jgi:glycosyltransferase involved in cell wall biosynthesis